MAIWLNGYMVREKKGFTMIELLVVMAILAILSAITYGQFRSSQIKARDGQRKADLGNISKALEMYYNDYGVYPTGISGKIDSLNWGDEFKDAEGTIYMKKLPRDPLADHSYCYESDGSSFRLFSILENEKDPEYFKSYPCNGQNYNWGVRSSNVNLQK